MLPITLSLNTNDRLCFHFINGIGVSASSLNFATVTDGVPNPLLVDFYDQVHLFVIAPSVVVLPLVGGGTFTIIINNINIWDYVVNL